MKGGTPEVGVDDEGGPSPRRREPHPGWPRPRPRVALPHRHHRAGEDIRPTGRRKRRFRISRYGSIQASGNSRSPPASDSRAEHIRERHVEPVHQVRERVPTPACRGLPDQNQKNSAKKAGHEEGRKAQPRLPDDPDLGRRRRTERPDRGRRDLRLGRACWCLALERVMKVPDGDETARSSSGSSPSVAAPLLISTNRSRFLRFPFRPVTLFLQAAHPCLGLVARFLILPGDEPIPDRVGEGRGMLPGKVPDREAIPSPDGSAPTLSRSPRSSIVSSSEPRSHRRTRSTRAAASPTANDAPTPRSGASDHFEAAGGTPAPPPRRSGRPAPTRDRSPPLPHRAGEPASGSRPSQEHYGRRQKDQRPLRTNQAEALVSGKLRRNSTENHKNQIIRIFRFYK